MSYDLMVFKPEAVPVERETFMNWYRIQTSWKETHGYNNPGVTDIKLQNWFMEMIQHFPAMNGPYANDEENQIKADYTIGENFIYITFPWVVAEKAYSLTKRIALKHNVGFFDVSADEGDIIFPYSS